MSNWVMVLYVITAFSNHGTRIPVDSLNVYEDKATCEAALVEPPHGRQGMECTPFFANMGPVDIHHLPDHLHRGRVVVVPR
jgi:hypothetical protein